MIIVEIASELGMTYVGEKSCSTFFTKRVSAGPSKKREHILQKRYAVNMMEEYWKRDFLLQLEDENL